MYGTMSNYRCKSGCLRCGYFWVTRKRNTTKPPARCPECKSSRTYVIESYAVDEYVFGEENYKEMLENMVKKYIKEIKEM